MKRTLILGLGALIVLVAVSASAQTRSAAPQGSLTQAPTGPAFVDNDGDGICDYYQAGTRPAGGQGNRRGTGDGTRVGPRDGNGFGRGPGSGGAACDGTGPKGRGRGTRN